MESITVSNFNASSLTVGGNEKDEETKDGQIHNKTTMTSSVSRNNNSSSEQQQEQHVFELGEVENSTNFSDNFKDNELSTDLLPPPIGSLSQFSDDNLETLAPPEVLPILPDMDGSLTDTESNYSDDPEEENPPRKSTHNKGRNLLEGENMDTAEFSIGIMPYYWHSRRYHRPDPVWYPPINTLYNNDYDRRRYRGFPAFAYLGGNRHHHHHRPSHHHHHHHGHSHSGHSHSGHSHGGHSHGGGGHVHVGGGGHSHGGGGHSHGGGGGHSHG